MLKNSPPLAIFDIDGTIFRSSLTTELLESLIEEGVFPPFARNVYVREYQKWLDRKGTHEEYTRSVVRAYNSYLKGVRHAVMLHVAKKVAAFHRDRVHRFTRDLVRDLKKKGYYLIAISHSSTIIVEEFCRHLKFDKIFGRIQEVDRNGVYTGKYVDNDLIQDKAKLIQQHVAKHGFSLRRSVGVGDTESDISFLRLVETPICFNPNMNLYRYAKRRGWEVVVERKDVVYTISARPHYTVR